MRRPDPVIAHIEGQGQGQRSRDVIDSHSSSSSSGSGICNDIGVGKVSSNTVSASQKQPQSSSSSSSSFAIPTIVPRKRKAVIFTGLDGKAVGKADESITSIGNDKADNSGKCHAPISGVNDDDNCRSKDKEGISPKDPQSCLTGIRSYTYSGRSDPSVRIEGCGDDDGNGKPKLTEAEAEKGEGCRLLSSDLHLIVMTHAEVSTLII